MREVLSQKRVQLLLLIGMMVFGLFIFGLVTKKNNPSRAIITVDKDTGESIISEPNKTPEQFNSTGDVLVLGAPKLIERGLTQGQFDLFRENIVKYVQQHFKQYALVKILPGDLSGEGTNISGVLKLGESDSLLEFSLKAYNLRYIELTVHDPAGIVPDFKTGKLGSPPVTEENEVTDL